MTSKTSDETCERLIVEIRLPYVSKLKQLAKLTDASVEAFVNQLVSDALESA